MIVVDTSALLAVLLDETDSARCIETMATDDALLISAGTLAETRIVATHRQATAALERLLADLGLEVVPVTEGDARAIAEAHVRWGKGVHQAGLNFGDCFAYVLAKSQNCPLLFVGDDFGKTDVLSAP